MVEFPYRRSRKRRSNRRKAQQSMQSACNAGLAPLNEVATNCEVNANSSYVMNTNTADTSSPIKKRKLSSQDLPGPSTYYTKSTSDKTPMSEFYHSLLESSYQDDLSSKFLRTKEMSESWVTLRFFPCSYESAQRGGDDREGATNVSIGVYAIKGSLIGLNRKQFVGSACPRWHCAKLPQYWSKYMN